MDAAGMTEDERLRRLADVLLAAEPVFDELKIDTVLGLTTIDTGIDLWQLERVTGWGTFVPGSGYRIYTARPARPHATRVRGLAQLEDGRTFTLIDRAGVSAFAATGRADPLVIGYLAALYADPADYPRRVLHTGDLAPVVLTYGADESVVVLHTARLDYSLDEETPFDRIERWRVVVHPAGAAWSIEVGGA